jgi:hypothetical protein
MHKPEPAPVQEPAVAQTQPMQPHREPIYFLKGDSTLSPGALAKLQSWTETWGTKGAWTLACPTDPNINYDLMGRRILALSTELGKLGAWHMDTRLLPKGSQGPYDSIYVEMDPAKKRVLSDLPRLPWIARTNPPMTVQAAQKAPSRPKVKVAAKGKKPAAKPLLQIAKLKP